MPELSIIVPVYKVEKYLPKCIESILAQTFTDFELILIDDGSPDRCGKICDEYAAEDSRIVVIHQKNQGVSAARNAGLDIAKGSYIGFVDSDDWIAPEMYQILYSTITAKHCDLVVCGSIQRSEDGAFLVRDFQSEGSYTREQLLKAMYSVPNPLGGVLWNKLFRAEIVGKLRFREDLRNCEDGLFLTESMFATDSGIKIPDALYNVVQRDFSASRSGNIQQVYHTVCGFEEIKKLLKGRKHSKELDRLATNMVLDNCVRFSKIIKEISRKTGAPCSTELTGIQKTMKANIRESVMKRLLSIRMIHGYYTEMRKMRQN
jgi:glycosyltransferase involved in cell wall biosynthesis